MREGALPELDWKAIADPATTTAVYMPTRTLDAFISNALAAGLDPATPSIAISRATRPDQQVVRAPIAELSRRMADASLPGPVLIVIGVAREGTVATAAEPAAAAN
jgi:uroporphyrin-III C-methyltransferase/precorrin-2 dehydrogenase/sirohydrochlorin ferrochelatase